MPYCSHRLGCVEIQVRASRKWWLSRTGAECTWTYMSTGSAEAAICRPPWPEYQHTLVNRQTRSLVLFWRLSTGIARSARSLTSLKLLSAGSLLAAAGPTSAKIPARQIAELAIWRSPMSPNSKSVEKQSRRGSAFGDIDEGAGPQRSPRSPHDLRKHSSMRKFAVLTVTNVTNRLKAEHKQGNRTGRL